MEERQIFPDWADKTILVAEDLDDNFAVLAALLKKTHVNLIRARDGAEAIELALNTPDIDLILMDISLPAVDGIQATKAIREQFPEKIVIAQTAHDPSMQTQLMDFNEILLKPIRRKLLINTLQKYLS
ncbi:MAG: response regulator [Odoribacter splanchnicus]|nr:response regulator [Odoribacter splanchnicus]